MKSSGIRRLRESLNWQRRVFRRKNRTISIHWFRCICTLRIVRSDDKKEITVPRTKHTHTAWVEVDLKAIRQNIQAIQRLSSRKVVEQRQVQSILEAQLRTPRILAVVKADGYGHGMIQVADQLKKAGVDFFGVAEVYEGIALRKHGIKLPILVLESPLSNQIKDIVDHNLRSTICTIAAAKALNSYARSAKKKAFVHIKVDTGMGRLGVWHTQALDFIRSVRSLKHVEVEGVYTHFPVADTSTTFTQNQIHQLSQVISALDQEGAVIPYVHAANSAGVSGFETHIFNMVRPGLMLYGLYPSPKIRSVIKLKPAMSVKARVLYVKDIEKGRSVSYGQTFVAPRAMRVATVPIGYNDGYMRILSNKSSILLNGCRCPVLGRVTMDQLVADVSRAGIVKIGDEAVILGRQGKQEVSADELARLAQTIHYEIVCSLGNRLPRIHTGK